jgi:transcriptional regulator with XRE-family HTH domain
MAYPVTRYQQQTISGIVAANIRQLRLDAGMTQTALAVLLRIYHPATQAWTEQKIGELEHTRKDRERNITVDDLVAVSWALNVEVWRLLLPAEVNDSNSDELSESGLMQYSWRVFGMPPDQIRKKADELILWPKTGLSPSQTRMIAMRHPDAIRVRAEWWPDEIAAGREPTPEGWGAALEEVVAECEAVLMRLQADESVTVPDVLIDLEPGDGLLEYTSAADDLWLKAL